MLRQLVPKEVTGAEVSFASKGGNFIRCQRNCKIVRMSHFYRQLHDRELLVQGEQILREIDRRKLLEILLLTEEEEHQETRDLVFPRRLTSITIDKGKLMLSVERSFFRPF